MATTTKTFGLQPGMHQKDLAVEVRRNCGKTTSPDLPAGCLEKRGNGVENKKGKRKNADMTE